MRGQHSELVVHGEFVHGELRASSGELLHGELAHENDKARNSDG